MLLRFLRRFGSQFDYYTEAVAVHLGGIVQKASCENERVYRQYLAGEFKLALEDPLTGAAPSGSASPMSVSDTCSMLACTAVVCFLVVATPVVWFLVQ